jgi:hypothetical protein
LHTHLLRRATLALVVVLMVCALESLWLTLARMQAHDFTWPYHAAQMLLHGQSPYTGFMLPGGPAFADPFFYPLPAALIALPFAPLPPELAGALWAGLSGGLLTYAVLRCAPHAWPMLLSAPAFVALRNAQWSPLLVAAALLWPLTFTYAAKPTLGFALWLLRPDKRAALLPAALVLISLIIMPDWPLDWLANVRHTNHHAPIVVLPMLALALLRWRDGRARLLLGLSIAPQMLCCFYDSLPLLLICRTRGQAIVLALCSWLAYALSSGLLIPAQAWAAMELLNVSLTYGAALVYVLLHPVERKERSGFDVPGRGQ